MPTSQDGVKKTMIRSVNSDHIKIVLSSFNLNGHILGIIYDSTNLHQEKQINFFNLLYFFCFSVGQMAVFPLSHYYSLHLLMLALQVSSKMEHLQIVCDQNTKKHVQKLTIDIKCNCLFVWHVRLILLLKKNYLWSVQYYM